MFRNKICTTTLKKHILISFLALIALVALVAVLVLMVQAKPRFFDEYAKKGVPANIPEEEGYSKYEAEEVCSVSLCGNPKIEDKTVYLYLTNPESNQVFLRAEIYTVALRYNEKGQIVGGDPDKMIGKSGFLRPGEYTEFVKLKSKISKEEPTNIMIKVTTYVEETGESGGFFYVNTVFKPQNGS